MYDKLSVLLQNYINPQVQYATTNSELSASQIYYDKLELLISYIHSEVVFTMSPEYNIKF